MAPTSADFEAQPALAEMPAQVTFKLSLRRDLRRWTPPVCLTYEAFVHGIQAAYELGPDCDLNLTYTDADGDQVTLASETDMQELYLQNLSVVRCTVTRKKSANKRALAQTQPSEPVKKQKKAARSAWLAKLEAKAASGNPKAQAKLDSLRQGDGIGNTSKECELLFSKLNVNADDPLHKVATADKPTAVEVVSGSPPTREQWKSQRVDKFLSKLNEILPRVAHRERPLVRIVNMLNNCANNVDADGKGLVVKALKRGGKRNPVVAEKLSFLATSGIAMAELPVELSPLAREILVEAVDMLSVEQLANASDGEQEAITPVGPWKAQRVDKFVAKLSEFLPRVEKRKPALMKICKMLNNCHDKLDEKSEPHVVEALVLAGGRDAAVAEKLRLLAADPHSPVKLAPGAKAILLKAQNEKASADAPAPLVETPASATDRKSVV